MGLKLNTSREAYKEFYGRNTEQMPKLIAEGRVPMSVAELMQRRLEIRNSDTKVKSFYMDDHFVTGDGIIYNPNGMVKIVLNSQHLRDMTPESPRNDGKLVLTVEDYNALQGEEFRQDNIREDDWFSRADVKAHPIWKALARNQTLLNDYTDYIFTEGNYNVAMGIFLSWAYFNGKTPEMIAWSVGGLEKRSDGFSRGVLTSDHGRLLGIAPWMLSASEKGTSGMKKYTEKL